MAVKRRTPVTISTSLGLPRDPMTVDPNVHVPATTRVSTNPTDVANPANPANPTGLTKSTIITSPVDPANLVDPNEQPLLPRVDPPLAPQTEGFANVEQPPCTTSDSIPRYYAGKIGLGIGEPHVDLGEDFEFARLREAVGQVDQTEEPPVVGSDAFA
uniref:Uncharacterized protein n=1 Tax=Cannabis sativa TaxID=3483 RepID=A0A803NIS2_CANSA